MRMNTKPLVSIVTTFYNTPSYFLRDSISSVLAQSYDNWELLLVNDGSTDESTRVAEKYAEQHRTKIYYLEHESRTNKGASTSRQLGIAKARGEYVAFLDSDDVYLPNKLTDQVSILESRPEAGMMYGNSLYWFSWSTDNVTSGTDYMPRLGIKPNTLVRPPDLLCRFLRGEAAVPVPCSVLVRKSTIERTGGFEIGYPQPYDDQVFYSKICLETPVFVTNRCWDKYRQHSSSSCAITSGMGQERTARIDFLHWLTRYIEERGYRDSPLWDAVEEELWWSNLRPGIRRVLKRLRPLRKRMRIVG
jgi:glycosyltransferase involved in cell wall biosynthesis